MITFIRLKQEALARGLAQKDLAAAAGLSSGAFSARMHLKADFTAGEMVKIGKVLGIEPTEYYDYFLADTAAQAGGRK